MMIKRINNDIKKNKFIIADFETAIINDIHIPYMFSLYGDDINHIQHTDTDKINKWTGTHIVRDMIYTIKKKYKKEKIIVYLHNMGGFDGILIMNVIKKDIALIRNSKILIRNNSIYQIKIFNNIHIRDSYKIINQPLNKILADFLKKKKLDIDTNNIANIEYIKKNIELLKTYCMNDSMLLFEALIKFNKELIKEFNTCMTEGLTISSIAFKIFRKQFYNNEIIANSAEFSEDIYKSIIEAYRGGIVDVYKPHGFNLRLYDINSAYPFAMLKSMPSGKPIKIDISNINNYNTFLDNFYGFICIRVKVNYDYIPFLGIKSTSSPANIYPYGEFIINIFSEELKYALKINKIKIIKIYKAIEFTPKVIFKDYILKIYNMRKETNNVVKKTIFKLMLNTLYGRFGMKRNASITLLLSDNQINYIRYIYDINIITKSIKNNKSLVTINIKNNIYKHDLKNLGLNIIQLQNLTDIKELMDKNMKDTLSAPQISAAITAYARIHIDKKKREILNKGGNIYYSDTDSVITDIKLTESMEIGGWKMDKKIKEGHFIAPKIYMISDFNNIHTCKFKGIPKRKINNLINNGWLKKTFNEVINNNTEKIYKISYNNFIKKNVKKMLIQQQIENRGTKFKLNKRIKKYKILGGAWYDTIPIKVKINKDG